MYRANLLVSLALVGCRSEGGDARCADASFVINNCDAAYDTLDQVLTVVEEGDVITVREGTHAGTVHRDETGELSGRTISQNITIQAEDGADVVFEPAQEGSAVLFVYQATVTLRGLTIRGGTGEVPTDGPADQTVGGGVYASVDSDLALEDCLVTGNRADFGGGIWSVSLTLLDTVIQDNSAEGPRGYGGGVYINGGALISDGGVLIRNNTATHGGGLWLQDSSASGGGLEISGNAAAKKDGLGGGAVVYRGELHDAVVSDNSAAHGGGLFVWGSTTVADVQATGNTALIAGGGLYASVDDGRVALDLSGFAATENTAEQGGGIALYDTDGVLTDVTLSGNTATASAGGLFAQNSDLSLDTVTVDTNNAPAGGGGVLYDSSASGGAFMANTASSGAGLQMQGTSTLIGATVDSNTSKGDGGGVSAFPINNDGLAILEGVSITDNTAASGGGIAVGGVDVDLVGESIVRGNVASQGGGLFLDLGEGCSSSIGTVGGNVQIIGNEATEAGSGGGVGLFRGNLFFDNGADFGAGHTDNIGGDVAIAEVPGSFALGSDAGPGLCSTWTGVCVDDAPDDRDDDSVPDKDDCDPDDPCIGSC